MRAVDVDKLLAAPEPVCEHAFEVRDDKPLSDAKWLQCSDCGEKRPLSFRVPGDDTATPSQENAVADTAERSLENEVSDTGTPGGLRVDRISIDINRPAWVDPGETIKDASIRWVKLRGADTAAKWNKLHRPSYSLCSLMGISGHVIREAFGSSMRANNFSWVPEGVSPLEACMAIAKRYDTREKFRFNETKVYHWAVRSRKIKEVASAMGWPEDLRKVVKWADPGEAAEEACFRIASRYSRISEWYAEHRSSYQYAHRAGIVRDIGSRLGWRMQGPPERSHK